MTQNTVLRKSSLLIATLFLFTFVIASSVFADVFDINTAEYAGADEEFSVITHEGSPRGLTFNNDGTKMFVIGTAGDSVVQYSLSTAYDVSTASYDGLAEEYDASGEDTLPMDLAFNSDGTKMFIIGQTDRNVIEYTLSSAYDVSTATHAGGGQEFDVSGEDTLPHNLEFNTDGTKMFILGLNSTNVIEYTLSTPFDVSTATHAGDGEELDVSGSDSSPRGLVFALGGSRLYITGNDGDTVDQYNLSSAYDVSTGSFAAELDVSSQDTFPTDVAFNATGTRLFVVGSGDGAVAEYTIVDTPNGKSYLGPSEPLTFDIDLSADFEKGMEISAGEDVQIEWMTSGTGATQFVNLVFEDLETGEQSYIAKHIRNTGMYAWEVSDDFVAGYVIAQATDLASVMSESRSGLLWDESYVEEPAEEMVMEDEAEEMGEVEEVEMVEAYGASPVTGELELLSEVMIGDYIMGASFDTVYYVDINMMRRPFMDRQTYFTWQDSFDTITSVTDATLTSLTLGAPMLPKPDSVLVTIPSIDTVYVLTSGEYDEPMLRPLDSEDDAERVYGVDWADYVIDIPLTLWTKFTVGEPIDPNEFEPMNSSMMKTRMELNS